MRLLLPDEAPADQVQLVAEATGVNLFLEIRKPAHEPVASP
jgi:hypothetical protein